MSNILLSERIHELQEQYPAEALAGMALGNVAEKAQGHRERLDRLARSAGGFVGYWVVGDSLHEDEHEAFCTEVGIDPVLVENASYTVGKSGNHAVILRRQLQIHEDIVYGITYQVDLVPYDRD